MPQTQVESDWMNENITPDFKRREFLCFCCAKEGVTDDLVFHLQLAHNLLPPHSVMIINSAYRCEEHNNSEAVGGSRTSSHLKGVAVDIRCGNSAYQFHLLKALIGAGFTRIGIGKDFIHADLDKDKAQNVIWTYYK